MRRDCCTKSGSFPAKIAIFCASLQAPVTFNTKCCVATVRHSAPDTSSTGQRTTGKGTVVSLRVPSVDVTPTRGRNRMRTSRRSSAPRSATIASVPFCTTHVASTHDTSAIASGCEIAMRVAASERSTTASGGNKRFNTIVRPVTANSDTTCQRAPPPSAVTASESGAPRGNTKSENKDGSADKLGGIGSSQVSTGACETFAHRSLRTMSPLA